LVTTLPFGQHQARIPFTSGASAAGVALAVGAAVGAIVGVAVTVAVNKKLAPDTGAVNAESASIARSKIPTKAAFFIYNTFPPLNPSGPPENKLPD
jgi:hypothetical protein